MNNCILDPNLKILIVSPYFFNNDSATSITLQNIFKDVPREQIAFLNLNESIEDFKNYRNITVLKKQKKVIVNAAITTASYRSLCDGSVGAIENPTLKRRILNYIHTVGSAYNSIRSYEINSEVDKFILDFSPTVIYTLMASISIMELCTKISKKYNVPIVPHFMDDWPSVMYANNIFLLPVRFIMKHSLNKLLRNANMGFAISDKMAKAYQNKYKKQFYTLMNFVDDQNVEIKHINEKKVVLTYAGGLHLNRISSILYLCKELELLENIDMKFNIYTNKTNWDTYKKELEKYSFIEYGGFVSQSEMLQIMRKSDVLVHIESFDVTVRNYIKYSISTKIPEYLSMKRLIIAIGPKDVASIEHLEHNSAALIVSNLKSDLVNKLTMYLKDNKEYQKLALNAYNLYLRDHKVNNIVHIQKIRE